MNEAKTLGHICAETVPYDLEDWFAEIDHRMRHTPLNERGTDEHRTVVLSHRAITDYRAGMIDRQALAARLASLTTPEG